ncbi:alkaline shock response membrane anchor protein AmaP [Aerococcus kribbianus]|uniref:Alkaline shock response membrane anchor protein AmaP n=1 Tax=Aerococcus kribbianus TaxID=2999064 RepID=A0A9X3FQP5_9LACT|nr:MULTISPECIES: alkaline shock response membrane anchor protein AmaP [unclassified Aerococcus]MCZ0717989.1 alkaline shock response membrane anchor protein AmaP [Aerococcus sp. YH-aer221]MCZ0726276.1 alkaline shock response membrane anchor protein AmaP [Aerococcus sp. YH-aer222]
MSGFNRFCQILFGLIFILTLVLTISVFYPIPWVSDLLVNYVLPVELYRWIVAGILAVILLLAVVMFFSAVFAAKTKSAIIQESDNGKIKLTKNALESTALRVLDQYDEVKYPKVNSKLIKKPEDTKLYVSFEMTDGHDVLDMAADIQTHIINAVELTLGVPLKHVEVKMQEVRPSQSNEQMEANRKAAKSRVQ